MSEKYRSSGEPGIQLPGDDGRERQHAADERRLDDAPLRMRYIHRPTNRAIGIVQAMVNVPQELPGTTWTHPAGRA